MDKPTNINPEYPPPGADPVLDWLRAQGLPDPGSPGVADWVDEHIIDHEYDHEDDELLDTD